MFGESSGKVDGGAERLCGVFRLLGVAEGQFVGQSRPIRLHQ
jgi:hypothetical protein